MCTLVDIDKLGQDALTRISNAIIDSNTRALTTLGTLWVRTKTPDLTRGPAPDISGHAGHAANIVTILGYATWIGLILAVFSLLALASLVAIRVRAGDGFAGAGRIGIILGGVLLLSGASSLVAQVLPAGPRGVGGATGFIQSSLWWYMAAAAIASVIIGAIRMIWEQRAEPGRDLLKSLLTLIVVAAGGVTMVNLLVTAADGFSGWVINNAMHCAPGDRQCFVDSVEHILKLGDQYAGTGTGPLLMIIIGLVALLSDLVQVLLMIARSGMLVLLAGVLPIAAAATNTEMGKLWFKRCVAWLAAFLLYKPVASLIYAAAFKLVAHPLHSQDALLNTLTGVMLLLLAVLALPALLRFVAPMAGAASGGHASGAAVMMAAGRLPSGARTTATNESARSTSTTTHAPSGSTGGGSGGPSAAVTGARTAAGGSGSVTAGAGTPQPARGAGRSDQAAAGPTGTVVTSSQASRGRRYTEGSTPASRLLRGAAVAAGAVHAITEEATGSGQ
ncbi:MAG: hypothetical protein J2P23_01530 [Microlunatus sp.]|nr:hypothetical protein [Microlunatus sp.]